MPLHGYDKWERFAEAIERVRITLANTGQDPDLHASRLREASGQARRVNYRLTRHAAYLIAQNADSRKPEVAAAQVYFAAKTREAEERAEVVPVERPTTLPDLSTYEGQIFLLDQYRAQVERARALELENAQQKREIEAQEQELEEVHAYADELEEDAEAFRNIVKDDGRDFSVRKAAGFVTRSHPRIDIGQPGLFEKLREWGLISKWNEPYRKWKRYVTSKPAQFTDPRTGERRWAEKDQVRVTWEGLSYIRRRLLKEIEAADAERRRTQEPDLFSDSSNVTKLPARRRGKRNGPGSGDATPTGA